MAPYPSRLLNVSRSRASKDNAPCPVSVTNWNVHAQLNALCLWVWRIVLPYGWSITSGCLNSKTDSSALPEIPNIISYIYAHSKPVLFVSFLITKKWNKWFKTLFFKLMGHEVNLSLSYPKNSVLSHVPITFYPLQ